MEQRVTITNRLRREGLLLAWQQSDEAAPANELDRALFLIDRIYPEMPEQHRERFRTQLEERWRAGTWHGFRRPAPLLPDGRSTDPERP